MKFHNHYQEVIEREVKRFNKAFYSHHIADDMLVEIRGTLNNLTERIYQVKNQVNAGDIPVGTEENYE
tara:strand:- start:1284 stop:1487 length:204 start_codon:yes stop_codon:yes gene_type:complete